MPRKLSDYFDDAKRGTPVSQRRIDEKDIKRIVELTVAEFLQPILGELNELKEAVKRVEEKLERIEERLDKSVESAGRGGHSPSTRVRDPLAKKVLEAVEKERCIYASTSRSKLKISGYTLLDVARRLGLEIIDLEGDYCVMSRQGYEEFRRKLSEVKTSDPEEAANKMGIYRDLFTRLRRAGTVYFDASTKQWRLLK